MESSAGRSSIVLLTLELPSSVCRGRCSPCGMRSVTKDERKNMNGDKQNPSTTIVIGDVVVVLISPKSRCLPQ